MGDSINGVFGFGAFVFLIFTMFDSYRTAEANFRTRLESKVPEAGTAKDRTVAAWGIFLIGLGVVFLLRNIIPYNFISRAWPVVFIALGAYLVFRSIKDREDDTTHRNHTVLNELEK